MDAEKLEERISAWVHQIKAREVDRAMNRLRLNGGPEREAVLELAERVCDCILAPVLEAIRQAERQGNRGPLQAAETLFLNGR